MLTAALISLTLLALLAFFQILLIAGAPIGRFAWGGQHKILPPKLRIGSVVSIGIYAFIAALILSKAGIWQVIPEGTFLTVSLWVVFAYFVLGVGMNAISRSKAERYTMAPASLVFAICLFIIAKGV
jgi:hypothetical protein